MAFASDRFGELELTLWAMALGYDSEHPRLFTVGDTKDLVVSTMQVTLSDTAFGYTEEDARAFGERAFILEMETTLLDAKRSRGTASDSGSIQLPDPPGTGHDDASDEEESIAEIRSMSMNENKCGENSCERICVVGPPWRLTQQRPISFFLASLRR